VKEDVPAIMGHLRWLKTLHDGEPGLTILVTHDDALFDRVTTARRMAAQLQEPAAER